MTAAGHNGPSATDRAMVEQGEDLGLRPAGPAGGNPSSHPQVTSSDVDLHPTTELDGGQLFRKYAPYVAAVALRLLGRDDKLADLVHDVFVVALKDLKQVRNPQAIKGWLATLAVHACASACAGAACVPS